MSIDWENMPEEMLQQIEEVRKSLEKTEKGFTRQTVENCTIAMEKDPLLSGAFCWNILTERPDIVKDLGWYREEPGITDSDMSHLILYLEKNYGLTSEKNVQHALDVVIANHHYHPVCDYLNALEWDGQERVLKELSENGGTMLQRELTERLQLQRASVSEILGKLELRALIVREQSMSNRRSQDIRLTAEGIRAAEEIAGRQTAEYDELFEEMAEEEKKTLYELLGKLLEKWRGRQK